MIAGRQHRLTALPCKVQSLNVVVVVVVVVLCDVMLVCGELCCVAIAVVLMWFEPP